MNFTTETDPDAPYAIMLYGYPGVGKTVLASFAKNPFLVLIDYQGDESLNNHPEVANIPRGVPSSFDDCTKSVLDRVKKKGNPIGDADTLIIDSITALREMEVKEQRDDQATPLSQFNWARNNQRVGDFFLELIQAGKKYGKNIILIGHVKEVKEGNDQSSTIIIRPDVSDSLLPRLAKNLSGIFYYEATVNPAKKRIERKLICRPRSNKEYAKTRYALPDEITEPNWVAIEDKIKAWRLRNQPTKEETPNAEAELGL